MRWYAILFVGFIFGGCAVQNVSERQNVDATTFTEEGATLVLCLSPVEEFRTAFEFETTKQFKFHDAHAEMSTSYLPRTLRPSKSTEKALDKLIRSLPKRGFNSLLVSAVSEVESEKVDAEGYFGDFKLFHFATHMYAIDDHSSTLVWSMCLCIYDYQIPLITVKDMAVAIVNKLFEDGILESNQLKNYRLYAL